MYWSLVLPHNQLNVATLETILIERRLFGAHETRSPTFFVKRERAQPYTPNGLSWTRLNHDSILSTTDLLSLYVVVREGPFALLVVGRLPCQKDLTLVVGESGSLYVLPTST